ncbi:MAG: hypothetical protein RIT28_2734, partial [Pseudomonadota bacterium]
MSRRDLFDVEALGSRWSRARPASDTTFDPDAHRGPPDPLAALPGAWSAFEASIRAELSPPAASAALALLATMTPPSPTSPPPDAAQIRALLAG